jgi:ribosomal protein S16
MIALGRDRVKIVLAQGGATKVGVFHIIVED